MKYKKHYLFLVLASYALLLVSYRLAAQSGPTPEQYIINGTVKDSYGPMPGVHVLIKGTNTGTFTDKDGEFSLTVTASNTLVFSYLGYRALEVSILGRTSLEVELVAEATQLQEVEVNAGYYTVKERERTGSISRVTAEEIELQPVSNPLAALQGQVTGLQIIQQTGVPGGGFDVRIRGRNSISSGNDPLFIINGVPYTAKNINSSAMGAPTGNDISPLNFINPNDIESIEVLKDADATAIYGSRGANGVILITTKQGRTEKTRLNIDAYSGIGEISNKLDLLNREQYLEMRNEAFANDGALPSANDYDLNGKWDPLRETDWQDVLIGGAAEITNIHGTISGGSKNTQFLLGGGYYKETTVFPGDFSFKKTTFNSNLNHSSNNQNFSLNFSINYSVSNNNFPGSDITGYAINLPPVAPRLFDDNGNLNWEDSTWINPLFGSRQPYESAAENFIVNASIGYRIISKLKFKANLGYTSLKFDETKLTPLALYDPALERVSGSSLFGDNKIKSWIIEPQISYNKNILKGKLNILLGMSLQQDKGESKTISATGFPNDALLENILAASALRVFQTDNSVYRYNALFGRINYNWKERYIINLTARRDGSSRFGPNKQFANFGAVGAAWIFSKEKFLNDNPFFSFGKIRASLGTAGNDQIGNYQFLDTYSPTTLSYGGVSGLRPTRLFNPNFGWEMTKKFEVGLESGLMQNKVNIISSYYRNRSSNQLLNVPLAPTTGFKGIQGNLPATVENTGLEFEIISTNFKNENFTWTTALNINFPKNKLIHYPNIETSSFASIYKEGKSLNVEYKLKFHGLDPETGLYTFEDFNGNELIDIGDLQFDKEVKQEYYGGFQNGILYKGLSFDFLFQFVKQTGMEFRSYRPPAGGINNQPKSVLNRWQQPGDIASNPPFTQSSSNPTYSNYLWGSSSDINIVDASFLRLQNISLSYMFDRRSIKNFNLQNLRVYIQAQNLFTITSFQGFDPAKSREVSTNPGLPPLRILTMGVHLIF